MKQAARTAYHHGSLKDALVDATRDIIEAQGVDQFTMRESARRAGVSHGAPAHHFGDKTGLLTQLAVQSFEERIALAQRYMDEAGSDPMARLRGCGMAHIEYAITHPNLHDLCARDGVTDRADPALRDVMQRMNDMLIGGMSAATGRELNPDKEANPTTLLALSVVNGFAALVNERIILKDVPETERTERAKVLAADMMALLEGAFRFRPPSPSVP